MVAITGSTELDQGQAKGFKVALNVPSVGDTTANLVFKEDKADCAFGASAGDLFPAWATSLQAKIVDNEQTANFYVKGSPPPSPGPPGLAPQPLTGQRTAP